MSPECDIGEVAGVRSGRFRVQTCPGRLSVWRCTVKKTEQSTPRRVPLRHDESWDGAAVKHMEVVGVRVEMPSNQPIVLLKEADGERYLPIWIGAVEATAIALAQQGVMPARPLTHDLFRDVLAALDADLSTVNITSLSDGIFYAQLVFSNGVEVSARPSDSIALALRTGAPIYAHEDVVEEAGVPIPDEQEDEVEKFREFLEQISPEDFGRTT